jgi:WD40 repeat protein
MAGERGWVRFSPDGRWLVGSGGFRGTKLLVWDAATGKKHGELAMAGMGLRDVSFNDAGTRLAAWWVDMVATADPRSAVTVVDVAAGKVVLTLPAERTKLVSSFAFSPDGKWLAVAEDPGRTENGSAALVTVWNTASGKERWVLQGHRKGVCSMAFTRDSRRLATGGQGKDGVKLWDLATGQELLTLPVGKAHYSLHFSPDGHRLVAWGAVETPGLIAVWDATPVAERK